MNADELNKINLQTLTMPNLTDHNGQHPAPASNPPQKFTTVPAALRRARAFRDAAMHLLAKPWKAAKAKPPKRLRVNEQEAAERLPGKTAEPVLPRGAGPGAPCGRNDPCPCGSEKKFKKCHGARNRSTDDVTHTEPAAAGACEPGGEGRVSQAGGDDVQ